MSSRCRYDGFVVPSDEDIKDQMEDAGWICNRRGWWHPPSCFAAWPFDEAKAMFLKGVVGLRAENIGDLDEAQQCREGQMTAAGICTFHGLVRLRVLVACEFSGTVRDAFRALGHDAMSCDLLPTEAEGPHYEGDVRDLLTPGRWDLMIAHPPCTHLAVSGARWFKDKVQEQAAALDFVRLLLAAPVPHIALENPVSIISSRVRKPDQVIQPWQHGHGETKATCLWLVNLPRLAPSNVVEGREARIWKMPPSSNRWKERSRTFPGVGKAMAEQWGAFCTANAESEASQ